MTVSSRWRFPWDRPKAAARPRLVGHAVIILVVFGTALLSRPSTASVDSLPNPISVSTATPLTGPSASTLPSTRPTTLLTFSTIADAYVSEEDATGNFGDMDKLRVDDSPSVISYVRFKVSGIEGRPVSSVLRVFVLDRHSGGFQVRQARGTWSEASVTYATRPSASGKVLDLSGPTLDDDWSTVDVSDIISGDGTYDLEFRGTNTQALSLASREAGSSRAPVLIVAIASVADRARTQRPQ